MLKAILRIILSRIFVATLMIVAVLPKIQAQEEFLRLDSIVVINQDLAISKVQVEAMIMRDRTH